jgi:uncharacterized membrane protein
LSRRSIARHGAAYRKSIRGEDGHVAADADRMGNRRGAEAGRRVCDCTVFGGLSVVPKNANLECSVKSGDIMSIPTSTPSKVSFFCYVAIAITAVVGVQILMYQVAAHYISAPAERGQFGDLFGVTNSTFSGLAFLALIYTIWLQQVQIAAQREAFENAKSDAEATKKSQDFSNNLSALMGMLHLYDDALERSGRIRDDGAQGALLVMARQNLVARRGELTKILEDMHSDVINSLEKINVR